MKREDYLELVNSSNFEKIAYLYYVEMYNDLENKSLFCLPEVIFISIVKQTRSLNYVIDKAVRFYDVKFTINKLYTKQGELMLIL
jgi:hypothetical protein